MDAKTDEPAIFRQHHVLSRDLGIGSARQNSRL